MGVTVVSRATQRHIMRRRVLVAWLVGTLAHVSVAVAAPKRRIVLKSLKSGDYLVEGQRIQPSDLESHLRRFAQGSELTVYLSGESGIKFKQVEFAVKAIERVGAKVEEVHSPAQ